MRKNTPIDTLFSTRNRLSTSESELNALREKYGSLEGEGPSFCLKDSAGGRI